MYRPFAYVLAAASLAACADSGDEGIQIVKNVAPPDDSCSFTSEETEPLIGAGTVHLFASQYWLHPQLTSRISADEGEESQRTVFTTGARVDIEFPDETLFSASEQEALRESGATHFESRFTVPIAPNGGRTDAAFVAIPTAFFDAVRAKFAGSSNLNAIVITKSVVYGTLGGGGGEVTSQPFSFPVTICTDCIVNVVGACPLPMGTMVNGGNACNPFQDGVVDCCVTPNQSVVCPAQVAQM
ncbi:MAG: hypothetical protein AB7O24_03125 [Kofleriaceae bacterium]